MNKEKFKNKSVQLCQSALNFSKTLEEAETLVEEINAPENKDDVEIKSSKLRKLKEAFSKLAQFCEDAFAESKELDRIPEKGDESIKRKTKLQAKNFSELNKKVKTLNESLQGVDALSSVSSNSKINFSEVISNKLATFSTEFDELKEISADAVDSVEETAEKVNEMIAEDKANKEPESPEIGNDSKPTEEQNKDTKEMKNFEEMKKELDETLSEAEEKVSQIKDEKKKAEFAEKLGEIKEEKMESADDIEQKLTHLEKFSAEFAELENDAKEAECEKCGKTPCECEEVKAKDEELNETIDEMIEDPKVANFARKLKSIKRIKCFSEDDVEDKLKAIEEVTDEVKAESGEEDTEVKAKDEELNETIDKMIDNPKAANFSKILTSLKSIKCFSDEELKEKLEATEEVKENIDKEGKKEGTDTKADVQKLAECVDKMEDILSEMNPSEELKEQFCGVDKAIQNFCDKPTAKNKEAIDETVEEFKESAEKEVKNYAARRQFSKLNKCFAEIVETISQSNLPESSVDKLTPPSEVGGTDVKSSVDADQIEKQNDEINDLLDEAEKAIAKIEDRAVKNFAFKRVKLISKMACFSEEDVEKKLDEAEELSEDVKATIEEEAKEKETKNEEPKAEPTKKADDPSETISDKEAANFSANKGTAPAWKSIYK